MANVIIDESSLYAIADAIREKLSVQTTYKPSEMADAIESISGGVTPTGTKQISITQNGTTTEDVTNYASAEMITNVPNSYAQTDEGKVVSNGALVAQTSDTVTANDTYDTTLINSLTVNVSSGGSHATGSFTLSSAKNTVTFEVPFEPTGAICYADSSTFPTDNTWKTFIEVYLGSSNGGVRVTRYGPSNYNCAKMGTGNFSYSEGVLSMKSDYNYPASVTFTWHAW